MTSPILGYHTVRYYDPVDLPDLPIGPSEVCEIEMPAPREIRLPVVAYRDGRVTVRWPDGRLQTLTP